MTPLEQMADALGIPPEEVARMTWPELEAARDRLVCDVIEAHEQDGAGGQ